MKRLLAVLMLVIMGVIAGCGGNSAGNQMTYSTSLEQNFESITEDTVKIEETNNNSASGFVSDNNVLPHNQSLKLSDTKDIIEGKESLSESSLGIEGLWESIAKWHVENSDFDISYSFDSDGHIQYITYMLIDASLDEIELGFTEVTARKELDSIYGASDGEWIINSDERQYTAKLEKSDENHSIQLTIMIKP